MLARGLIQNPSSVCFRSAADPAVEVDPVEPPARVDRDPTFGAPLSITQDWFPSATKRVSTSGSGCGGWGAVAVRWRCVSVPRAWVSCLRLTTFVRCVAGLVFWRLHSNKFVGAMPGELAFLFLDEIGVGNSPQHPLDLKFLSVDAATS